MILATHGIEWVRAMNGTASLLAFGLATWSYLNSWRIGQARYRWHTHIMQWLALVAFAYFALINWVGAIGHINQAQFTPWVRYLFPILVLFPPLVRAIVLAPIVYAVRDLERRKEER